MGTQKFFELIKTAGPMNLLNDLPKPPEIKPIASLSEPPKAPKVPKVKKIPELKLDTGLGKAKPFAKPEMKINSPYNEK